MSIMTKTNYDKLDKTKLEEMIKKLKGLSEWIQSYGVIKRMESFGKTVNPFMKRVPLKLNLGGGSYTDGNTVTVGLPELLFTRTSEEQLYALKALIAHEYGHVRVSDFGEIKGIMAEADQFFEKRCNKKAGWVAKELLNAVEDGRMEKLQSTKYPGVKKYFDFLNLTFWEESKTTGNLYRDYLMSICYYATSEIKLKGFDDAYPIGTPLREAYENALPRVIAGVNSDNPKDCATEVIEIMKENADFIELLLKEDEENKGENEGQSSEQNEYLNSPGQGGDQSEGKEKASNSVLSNNGQTSEKTLEGDEGETKEKTGEEIEKEVEERLTQLRKEAKKEGTREKEAIARENKAEEERKKREKKEKEDSELSEQELVSMMGGRKFRYVSSYNPQSAEIPIDLKRKAERFKKDVEKIFLNKSSHTQTNRRSGQLDVNALWRAQLNEKDLFIKRGTPKSSDYAVSILVDNSGSMDYNGSEDKSKRLLAKEASAVVEHALKDFVSLSISQFDADYGEVRSNVIKGWHDRSKKNYSWSQQNGSGAGNSDGYSIGVAYRELLKRPEANKILFVLSDGLPVGYSSQEEALKHVHDTVEEARKSGIIVIGIRFGEAKELERSAADYKQMYDHSYVSCAPAEILKQLTKTLKKALDN